MIPETIANTNEFYHLRTIVLGHGIPFAFERSARFRDGELSDQRCLFTVPLIGLEGWLPRQVLSVCHSWNAPPQVLETISRYLSRAEHVHFGLEIQPDSVTTKCYLEANVDLRFLGFKWTSSDTSRPAILSRYRVLKGIRLDRFQNLCEHLVSSQQLFAMMSLFKRLLTPDEELNLLEISDESTNRYSYDINCYDCEKTIGECNALMDSIMSSFGIDHSQRERWQLEVSKHMIGNIGIGADRNQRPFVTIYHKPSSGGTQ